MLILRKLWNSLHEPRIIAALMIGVYVSSIVIGCGAIWVAVRDVASWVPDWLAMLAGGLFIAAGLIGVPSAWRGRWWIERGAALLLIAAGATMLVASLTAVCTHPAALDRVLAYFAMGGAPFVIQTGANRWLRVKLDPYAPGSGPQTPIRREQRAVAAMMATADRR